MPTLLVSDHRLSLMAATATFMETLAAEDQVSGSQESVFLSRSQAENRYFGVCRSVMIWREIGFCGSQKIGSSAQGGFATTNSHGGRDECPARTRTIQTILGATQRDTGQSLCDRQPE